MLINLNEDERIELLKAWGRGAIDTSKLPSLRKYLINDDTISPATLEAFREVDAQFFKIRLFEWVEDNKDKFDPGTFAKVREVVKQTEPDSVQL